MNTSGKRFALDIAIVIIVAIIWYIEMHKPPHLDSPAKNVTVVPIVMTQNATSSLSVTKVIKDRTDILKVKAKKYSLAKELTDVSGYINHDPFKLADLVGKKVILLDFWTYSCINCLRTIPYLSAWYDKYESRGFVIVGVHTPEFDFEKTYANVASAVKTQKISYPVVLDNNYGTWNAYNNQYWPRHYLIDIDGYVVEDHIGEGGYNATELKIQELLKERAVALGEKMDIADKITLPNADSIQAYSPETYFGFGRNEYLGNGTAKTPGEQTFSLPNSFEPNTLYLGGKWNMKDEYALSEGSDTIEYLYNSKGVYLVAGSSGSAITVEVLRDGKTVDSSVKGADIFYQNGKSYVKIEGNRLYKIVEDKTAGNHDLKFLIPDAGLQVFTFTFG